MARTPKKQRSEKPHERIAALKKKADEGPQILQYGFRPFFLLAGILATIAIPLWLVQFTGHGPWPGGFDALGWHIHEMIFGFAAAAMAGFSLTAIPNWTGRLPVSGWRLAILVILWLLGRAGMAAEPWIGAGWTAALDLPFLIVFAAAAGREVTAGNNLRNLPVVGLIAVFALGNVLMHLEKMDVAYTAILGYRMGIFVLVMLVAVIGGRIVPSFTINVLKRRGEEKLPAGAGGFDRLCLLVLLAAALFQVFYQGTLITGAVTLAAGVLHGARLVRWRSWRTLDDPLLFALHLGYLWLIAALLLLAAADLTTVIPPSAALHALTTGAFATMILAVMTRASLGHTGRALTAGMGTTLIFVFITLAAILRVFAFPFPALTIELLSLSAVFWTAAFALFTVLYFPVLTGPRVARRAPQPAG